MGCLPVLSWFRRMSLNRLVLSLASSVAVAGRAHRLHLCCATSKDYVVGAKLPPSGLFRRDAGGWIQLGFNRSIWRSPASWCPATKGERGPAPKPAYDEITRRRFWWTAPARVECWPDRTRHLPHRKRRSLVAIRLGGCAMTLDLAQSPRSKRVGRDDSAGPGLAFPRRRCVLLFEHLPDVATLPEAAGRDVVHRKIVGREPSESRASPTNAWTLTLDKVRRHAIPRCLLSSAAPPCRWSNDATDQGGILQPIQ